MADPTAGIGSLADWVAAGGTLAAFGIAFVIWRSDERRRRRALGNSFHVLITSTNNPTDDQSDTVFYYTNLADGPVIQASIDSYNPGYDGKHEDLGRRASANKFSPFRIEGKATGVGMMEKVGPAHSAEYALSWTDSAGESWYQIERDRKFRHVSEHTFRAWQRDNIVKPKFRSRLDPFRSRYHAWMNTPRAGRFIEPGDRTSR